MSDVFYSYAFQALGNPIRREILAQLQLRPISVVEITENVEGMIGGPGCSRSSISQHLQMLLQAELVSYQAKGSSNIYQLRPQTLYRLRDYVDELLQVAEPE